MHCLKAYLTNYADGLVGRPLRQDLNSAVSHARDAVTQKNRVCNFHQDIVDGVGVHATNSAPRHVVQDSLLLQGPIKSPVAVGSSGHSTLLVQDDLSVEREARQHSLPERHHVFLSQSKVLVALEVSDSRFVSRATR